MPSAETTTRLMPPWQRHRSNSTAAILHQSSTPTDEIFMARYTGPKTKVSRRYGVLVHGSPKAFENKNYPPGQHGPKGARRKLSDYALALAEKQKLRYQYGVLERQFRRYFQLALSKRGVTGETLLQLLETRLDNVVQKLGFAKTLRAARQMVSHGHITVNGRKANISSMNVRAGDKVAVKRSDRSKRLALKSMDQTSAISTPEWLVADKENLTGTVVRIPTRNDINPIINEQLVVELYSR
jgi:small subunit ribosomal protein S4